MKLGIDPDNIRLAREVRAVRSRIPGSPVCCEINSFKCWGLSLSGPAAEPGLKDRIDLLTFSGVTLSGSVESSGAAGN